MGQPTSNRLQWLMGAAGVLMLAGAVWVAFANRAPEPRAAATPVAVRSQEPVSMFVQHDGTALRLHWNPDSDAIRRATAGALVINDGQRRSRLELGPAELRSGVASYWPESSGVDFKLELDGAVAAELHAPALAIREEPRPSPFDAPKPKHAARRVSVEEPDEDMPKPHTVRAVDAPAPRHDADRKDEASGSSESGESKPSRWHRVAGKIPLLRRLHKH